MSAPRIDSARNAVDAALLLLAEFRDEMHDIHDLAYSRSRAVEADRVSGGSRDFALDTHGDMRARELYEKATRAVLNEAGLVGYWLGEIRSHITKTGTGSAGFDRKAVAPKHEVAAAIAAAQRRRARGEQWETFHHPIAPQPRLGYIEPTAELENLRNAVRKMENAIRKMAPAKPDRSRLTPAEQDAWRRATTAGESARITA